VIDGRLVAYLAYLAYFTYLAMNDDLYKEEILEHYWDPHNHGVLEHPDATAEELNVLCGDTIRMDFAIANGKIMDVRFQGEGCAISKAAASMLTDVLKGKDLQQAQAITQKDIFNLLKIPISPARTKCALLGFEVMKKALCPPPTK